MKHLAERAFTLIELLVVILMLGILASLVVPRVMQNTVQAQRSKAISDIQIIEGMLRQFRTDTGRYPTTDEGLDSLRTAPPGLRNWQGPYLDKEVPLDPWKQPYHYTSPSLTSSAVPGDKTYDLSSYGPDGARGGIGDAAEVTDATQNP